MRRVNPALLCLCAALSARAQYVVTTFAGGALPNNVKARSVSFAPQAIATDRSGNLFVADQYTIYRVSQAGTLTVYAGAGVPGSQGDGGPATSASLTSIGSIAADHEGNLYVADTNNNRVRRIAAATGVITTVAGGGVSLSDGGRATDAQLGGPAGVAVDSAGDLYIAEIYGGRVRRVAMQTGTITTVAGTGFAGSSGDGGSAILATLNGPHRLAIDALDNLYIAEAYGFRVRKVNAFSRTINTVAGSGVSGNTPDGRSPLASDLGTITGIVVDTNGFLYIADGDNHRVRRVPADLRTMTTVAGGARAGFEGDDGPATRSLLNGPAALAFGASGVLLIADTRNNRVRSIEPGAEWIRTEVGGGGAGDGGDAAGAHLNRPTRLAISPAGDLYVFDCGSSRIRRINLSSRRIEHFAGAGYPGFGGDGGDAAEAQFRGCGGLAVDPAGWLYAADTENYRVRRMSTYSRTIDTLAGAGLPGSSRAETRAQDALLRPDALAADGRGNLMIADARNHFVRQVTGSGMLRNIAGTGEAGLSGDGGPPHGALLAAPSSVAADSMGNLYIADTANQRIRRIDAARGVITTIAGTGVYGHSGDDGPATAAELGNPSALTVDAAGNLYFLESAFGYIRRISANGIITTIAGGGTGGDDAPAKEARLLLPTDIAIDTAGAIYVAEPMMNRVRKLSLGGLIPQIQTDAVLPTAIVHQRYAQQLAASGGTPPYRTWVLVSGTMPKGLVLDSSAGVLSGTPSKVGHFAFSVEVTDNAGAKSEKRFGLAVRPVDLPRRSRDR